MGEQEDKRWAPLWRPLPSGWMSDEEVGLKSFKAGKFTSSNAAALMVLYAMCIHIHVRNDPLKSIPHNHTDVTYGELSRTIGISRLLVSNGIKVLEEKNLISKKKTGRNNLYKINNLEMKKGFPQWCKIPFRYFSSPEGINGIFGDLNLRNKNSLHAMKLYFLILNHRYDINPMVHRKHGALITYINIVKKTGLQKKEIKEAISILESSKLIYCEKIKINASDYDDFKGESPGIQKEDIERFRFNFYQVRGFDSKKGIPIAERKEVKPNESGLKDKSIEDHGLDDLEIFEELPFDLDS